MPEISGAELADAFRRADTRRATPEGARDMEGITAMMGKFSGELPDMIGPAMEQYKSGQASDIQDLLCASYRCATLTPGDFSRQAFENIIGFQSLMHACGRDGLDAAVRLSVLHRRDFVKATSEDKETAAALVFVRIYPPQKYSDGYLEISKDDGANVPLQFWTPEHIALPATAPSGPVRLMKQLQFKCGGSP